MYPPEDCGPPTHPNRCFHDIPSSCGLPCARIHTNQSLGIPAWARACIAGAIPGHAIEGALQGLSKGILEKGLSRREAIKLALRETRGIGLVAGCASGELEHFFG